MTNKLVLKLLLSTLPDESLDAVLCMPIEQKVKYFSDIIDRFYSTFEKNTDEYNNLLEHYISSFYAEKIYRSNRFLNEKFIVKYTDTGLIRAIESKLFYMEEPEHIN